MPIEDFEWEEELELLATPPSEEALRSWVTRLRQSVWLEPALRLLGVAAFLLGLTGLGIVATTYAKPGVKLPETPARLAAVLGTSWLKPTPVEEGEATAHAARAEPAASPSGAAGAAPQPPVLDPPPAVTQPSGLTPDGKVILNLASAEELTRLPGVGAKRAELILALRTKLTRFRKVTDLLRVKGIGPRGLKRMLPHLVLDAP